MGLMKNLAIERRESGRSRRSRRRTVQLEDRERYLREWKDNMVTYWKERIDKLRVIDTGNLRSRIEGELLLQGAKATITHSFPAYGVYVDDGTGREFTTDGYTDSLGRYYASSRGGEGTWNSGQLPFLLPGGEQYREDHGRVAGGHPRRAKPWYWRKYYASRMVLNDLEQEYFGEQYMGMLTAALDEVFEKTRML